MPAYHFEQLRPFQDKLVNLRSTTGEVMRAKVGFVSDSESDLLVEILETNRPQDLHPAHRPGMWYAIPFEYIAEIVIAGDQ